MTPPTAVITVPYVTPHCFSLWKYHIRNWHQDHPCSLSVIMSVWWAQEGLCCNYAWSQLLAVWLQFDQTGISISMERGSHQFRVPLIKIICHSCRRHTDSCWGCHGNTLATIRLASNIPNTVNGGEVDIYTHVCIRSSQTVQMFRGKHNINWQKQKFVFLNTHNEM